MRIVCLHTAATNVAVFDAAARPLGLALAHRVEPGLLAQAERAGGLTPALRAQTATLLAGLRQSADAVVLTCSTLGPAATGEGIVRADMALARAAAGRPGRIVVLCAVVTTLAPTRAIFAATAGARAEIRLVPGAWALFRTGGAYLETIAAAADAAYDEGAAVVALAQASMTDAAARCNRATPITSPAAALRAALDQSVVAAQGVRSSPNQ